MHRRSIFLALAGLAAVATPAFARPGGWGGPGWGEPGWGEPGWDGGMYAGARSGRDRSGEGHVEVSRFVASGDAAQALGHGEIAVASQTEGENYVAQDDRAPYEAAVVDQLVHAGYDTAHARPDGGQVAELRVTRTVVEPAEAKHSPVSGEMDMGVSNRGSGYGLALAVDLRKPLPALISTKLEARIRDRASNTVLWEGRAEVATREGDSKWSEQTIATRLAAALFDGFPRVSDKGAKRRD